MLVIQKYIPILFSIGLINIGRCYCSIPCQPKIAIIGAGIGGSSASYFLSKLFETDIEIDIFESKKVGGRLATIHIANEEYEAGGCIIHPRNKYMNDFSKLLKLSPRPPSGGKFGIWNSKEFVFEESDWESITLLKLFYKYGFQPYYLHKYINTILNDFEKIYTLQDEGIGFENVTALIGAMNGDFINLLQISIKEHLTKLGYSAELINELVEATLVVNYGQDTDLHAFVASVSIAGAGFNLWSIKGGNKKVPEKLISDNQQVTLLHATVEKIQRYTENEDEVKYQIFYKEDGKENSDIYDIVIIAAPMTSDQISPVQFEGFESQDLPFSGEYQTTIATFVVGKVNYSYFGLNEEIEGILSCNPTETIISSIGRISSVEGKKDDGKNVWKIFSRAKLDDSILNKMFISVDEIKEIDWKAYPRYLSADKTKLNKFKLDDAMYYVNAIEWAASAMEMSAIGGRNVANLAFKDYQQKCSLLKVPEGVGFEKVKTYRSDL